MPLTPLFSYTGYLAYHLNMPTPRTNEPEEQQGEGHLGRNLAMGAAAALPMAGLIGQQKTRRYDAPHAELNSLIEQVRPGDVVLSGSTRTSPIKDMLATAMGSPDAYHTAVAIEHEGRLRNFGLTQNAGTDIADFNPQERYTILRPNLDPEGMRTFQANVQRFREGTDSVRNEGAVVPYEGHAAAPTSAAYARSEGVSNVVKDLLLPKVNRYDPREHARLQQEVLKTPDVAAAVAAKIKATPGITPEKAYQILCEHGARGGICSNVPAMLLPAGHSVNPNKRVDEILPTDYLNSEMFTPVGRYSPKPFTWRERMHQAGPTAARLGVGLAGAGAVYGGSKLIDYLRKRWSGEDGQ